MEPTTRAPQKSSPKDVFLHLLLVGTLYVSATSLITLLFQYVNALLPDELYTYTPVLSAIRWATAILIIVFPTFLFLARLLEREMAAEPAKRDLRVRKWLLNLTLFIAAVTVIIDLIALIYNFLSGEITLRFFLKVAVVFAVAGTVFKYYLWELRRSASDVSSAPRLAARVAAGILAIAVGSGFAIVGSPFHQRAVRLDERRVMDLQMIQNEVIGYWQTKHTLPITTDALTNPITGFAVPKDPETGAAYEYRAMDSTGSPQAGATAFELCATFAAPSEHDPATRTYYGFSPGENWDHGEGRICFTRTIDPERYPKPRD